MLWILVAAAVMALPFVPLVVCRLIMRANRRRLARQLREHGVRTPESIADEILRHAPRSVLLALPLFALLPGCSLIDWGTRATLEGPGEFVYVVAGQPVPEGAHLAPFRFEYYTASDKALTFDRHGVDGASSSFASNSNSEVAGASKQSEYRFLEALSQQYALLGGQLIQAAAAASGRGAVPIAPGPSSTSSPPALGLTPDELALLRALLAAAKPPPASAPASAPAKQP